MIETITPTQTIEYGYNINGIRTSKTTDSDTLEYIVDSNRDYAQVIQEINNGSLEVSYTYGHDLLSQNRDNTIHRYHYDGLGSARFLSNTNGDFSDSYDYEAFGKLISSDGNTTNNYLYTGEQFDKETQNYYLRAGYFSPSIGRFTQQDTYMGNNQDPITLHKYLYANANPTNMIDPTGNYSMLSMVNTIAIRASLIGVRGYLYYETINAIINFDLEASIQDWIFELILSRLKIDKFLDSMNWIKKLSKKVDPDPKKSKPDLTNCATKNSFVSGTLVATQDGLIPIEEIKIGDKVWAYNEDNKTKSLQEVTHLIRGEKYKEIVEIELTNGEIITTTDNHPFYTIDSQAWLEANELTTQSVLVDINDTNTTIKSLKSYKESKKVYNLTVANDHTYYVPRLYSVLGGNVYENHDKTE